MVEGPECHRVAAAHRRELVGKKFKATSPNGRFADGAAAISGRALDRIEVVGKNMFYFFGDVVVRVHFGMAGQGLGLASAWGHGQFATYNLKDAPEAGSTVRLRLDSTSEAVTAFLSAMTVEHGSVADVWEAMLKKLGPDPLREDASVNTFASKLQGCKKSIGAVLMDQSFVAGIGNIYRSEILAEVGVHPDSPAGALPQKRVEEVWAAATRQMQYGFKTGSLWNPAVGAVVYSKATCSRCKGKVTAWTIGGRNAFACAKCQVKLDAAQSAAASTSKAAAAKGATSTPRAGAKKATPKAAVKQGTAHLGEEVHVQVATARKRAAGESLAVQHVALKDNRPRKRLKAETDADQSDAVAAKQEQAPAQRKPAARARGGSAAKPKSEEEAGAVVGGGKSPAKAPVAKAAAAKAPAAKAAAAKAATAKAAAAAKTAADPPKSARKATPSKAMPARASTPRATRRTAR